MPIYPYKCDYCGHALDEWLSSPNPKPTIACPICKHDMKRRYAGVRINYNMNSAYVPGVNAEHDIDVANDYYEHRLYSEDQQKQNIAAHKPNRTEL